MNFFVQNHFLLNEEMKSKGIVLVLVYEMLFQCIAIEIFFLFHSNFRLGSRLLRRHNRLLELRLRESCVNYIYLYCIYVCMYT